VTYEVPRIPRKGKLSGIKSGPEFGERPVKPALRFPGNWESPKGVLGPPSPSVEKFTLPFSWWKFKKGGQRIGV